MGVTWKGKGKNIFFLSVCLWMFKPIKFNLIIILTKLFNIPAFIKLFNFLIFTGNEQQKYLLSKLIKKTSNFEQTSYSNQSNKKRIGLNLIKKKICYY